MIAFWIAAAALSAAAAGLMLARAARAAAPAEDPVLAVHRRQLSEIDDLAARGLLPEAEHKAARAEAGRRLLAVAGHEEAPVGGGRKAAFIAAAATPLLAMGVYFAVGHPDMADAPYAERVAQWREAGPARLDAAQVAAVLKVIVAERPGDPAPLRDLAMAQLASGDAMGAVVTLRKAVAAAPQRADLWVMLGEAFVAQADGEVGADARLAFAEALKRDPNALTVPSEPDIRGMVEGLAARLEAEPDDAEGWVRLVRAWSVLGETARRDAALARARALFKARPEVLTALDAAAVESPR